MIGPEKLARVGLESAIAALLKTLPQAVKSIPQLWVWAGKDTTLTARAVQAWRTPSNVILKRAPKEAATLEAWDLAIVVPRPERATEVAAALLKTDRPVCILMPTDLVHYTSQTTDHSADVDIDARIAYSQLIALTAPCMTWVCHKTDIERNEIYAGEETTPVPGPMGDRTEVGSLEEWIIEQKPSLVAEAALMK